MSTLTARALGGPDPCRVAEPGADRRDPARAYDPAVAATLERHGEIGQSLATAGPVAVTETWTRPRTDTGYHVVLWISEWPRSMVYPGFLAPLVLSSGIGRSLSRFYTPRAPIRRRP